MVRHRQSVSSLSSKNSAMSKTREATVALRESRIPILKKKITRSNRAQGLNVHSLLSAAADFISGDSPVSSKAANGTTSQQSDSAKLLHVPSQRMKKPVCLNHVPKVTKRERLPSRKVHFRESMVQAIVSKPSASTKNLVAEQQESGIEFKSDPGALQSIINNQGVATSASSMPRQSIYNPALRQSIYKKTGANSKHNIEEAYNKLIQLEIRESMAPRDFLSAQSKTPKNEPVNSIYGNHRRTPLRTINRNCPATVATGVSVIKQVPYCSVPVTEMKQTSATISCGASNLNGIPNGNGGGGGVIAEVTNASRCGPLSVVRHCSQVLTHVRSSPCLETSDYSSMSPNSLKSEFLSLELKLVLVLKEMEKKGISRVVPQVEPEQHRSCCEAIAKVLNFNDSVSDCSKLSNSQLVLDESRLSSEGPTVTTKQQPFHSTSGSAFKEPLLMLSTKNTGKVVSSCLSPTISKNNNRRSPNPTASSSWADAVVTPRVKRPYPVVSGGAKTMVEPGFLSAENVENNVHSNSPVFVPCDEELVDIDPPVKTPLLMRSLSKRPRGGPPHRTSSSPVPSIQVSSFDDNYAKENCASTIKKDFTLHSPIRAGDCSLFMQQERSLLQQSNTTSRLSLASTIWAIPTAATPDISNLSSARVSLSSMLDASTETVVGEWGPNSTSGVFEPDGTLLGSATKEVTATRSDVPNLSPIAGIGRARGRHTTALLPASNLAESDSLQQKLCDAEVQRILLHLKDGKLTAPLFQRLVNPLGRMFVEGDEMFIVPISPTPEE